jgi:hypothetical protein
MEMCGNHIDGQISVTILDVESEEVVVKWGEVEVVLENFLNFIDCFCSGDTLGKLFDKVIRKRGTEVYDNLRIQVRLEIFLQLSYIFFCWLEKVDG